MNNIGTPIYAETTLQELRSMPEFKDFSDWLFYRGFTMNEDESELSLRQFAFDARGGDVCDFLYGLKRVQKIYHAGIKIDHEIWSEEEKVVDPDKAMTKLLYMPCEDENKPFIVFIAGGGYEDIYTLSECFSCAARANELGFNAFILSYRILMPGGKAILPKPLDDLAQALKIIMENKDTFKVSTENYALCGFSAGGHIAAEWGTDNLGYAHYGMPKPGTLILCYAVTSFDLDSGERLLNSFLGDERTAEHAQKYDVISNTSDIYPPTFLYHCKNDNLVPYRQAVNMDVKLNSLGIPHKLKLVERGYHGYGLATGTMSDGWLDEAIAFWQAQ